MNMDGLEILNLENLDHGAAMAKVDEYLRNAARDCLDRPDVQTKRTVTLSITISTNTQSLNAYPAPQLSWDAGISLPKSKGNSTIGMFEGGKLYVPTFDQNAAQGALFDNVTDMKKAEG